VVRPVAIASVVPAVILKVGANSTECATHVHLSFKVKVGRALAIYISVAAPLEVREVITAVPQLPEDCGQAT